jgi:hypothetical protein
MNTPLHTPDEQTAPLTDPSLFQNIDFRFEAPQRKKRITFWMMWCLILLGVSIFADIAYSFSTIVVWTDTPGNAAKEITNVINAIHSFLSFPCFAAYCVCYFFYVFCLWAEVPPKFARTMPEIAAGLSLVPFYTWSWMFVALPGLYQDMNKTMLSYGHSKRFNTTLMIAACILWLVSNLFSIMFIFGVTIGILLVTNSATLVTDATEYLFLVFLFCFYCIWICLWLFFTAALYRIICRDVLEFVEIKESLEK